MVKKEASFLGANFGSTGRCQAAKGGKKSMVLSTLGSYEPHNGQRGMISPSIQ